MPNIAAGSHVTLHYRLAVLVDGGEREVVSTFDARPATMQIGSGQLSPSLEMCLIGLGEGARASFDFAPDQAYGRRSAELVQTMSREFFDANVAPDASHGPGDVVEFDSPDGGRVAGVLKDRGDRRVIVDFNHPLAGWPLRFSVHVIGVL